MSEKIADIVAQMRGRGEDGRMDMWLWRQYADRIEAAWKREKAEIEADALAVGGIVEAARHKPVGNAAAMREALASVRNWCINKLGGASIQVRVEGLLQIVDNALSEPARNCDVYATPDKASKMFEASIREAGKLGFINPYTEVIKWLLVPAAERKGEGDA